MTFPFEAYYLSPSSPTYIVGADKDSYGLFCSYLNGVCERYGLPYTFETEGEPGELDYNLEQFLRWMTFADIIDGSSLTSLRGTAAVKWESAVRQLKSVDAHNRAVTYWNRWADESDNNTGRMSYGF